MDQKRDKWWKVLSTKNCVTCVLNTLEVTPAPMHHQEAFGERLVSMYTCSKTQKHNSVSLKCTKRGLYLQITVFFSNMRESMTEARKSKILRLFWTQVKLLYISLYPNYQNVLTEGDAALCWSRVKVSICAVGWGWLLEREAVAKYTQAVLTGN